MHSYLNYSFLSYFEDIIELNVALSDDIDNVCYNWIQYNPRKPISRFGCSITSLDGTDSGIPDLDSIVEYNNLNNTNYREKDFCIPTKHSKPFTNFLQNYTVGRSHYIKLTSGGFFPWHRDNDGESFRIIYTIENCENESLVWVQNDKALKLENRKWYYINTKQKHCVFSFSKSIFAVFNVLVTEKNLIMLSNQFKIK